MAFELDTAAQEADPEALFIDFMIERQLIESGAAERARAALRSSGQPVDTVLSELGLIGEAGLAEAQAAFLDLPIARQEDFPAEPVQLEALSPDFLRANGVLPLAVREEALIVATARALETDAIRSVAFFLDMPVRVLVAAKRDVDAAFKDLYGEATALAAEATGAPTEAADDDVERLKDIAREAPVIRLVARLVAQAVERRASDIHLEPAAGELRVRYRIDGALETTEKLARGVSAGVVTRIKILANLNIAERRLPQDGRMKVAVRGRDLDIRVSTTPTLYGESVALRVLDWASIPLSFPELGFSPAEERTIRDLIAQPNGIVLVTGPTGSGKTTTLYAALLELNRETAKVFTVEDPIEYQLPGISQIQVKPGIGLDFAACLRSILRQDPDVIMVGEIRDAETARMAVQSALTGHLVLATLHTNSAAAAVTRLIDMGIEPYLVASTVRGIIAQRLVRRVCAACSKREEVNPRLLAELGHELGEAAARSAPSAQGCAACHQTGYAGRTTIAEILTIDAGVRDLVLARAPDARIEEHARARGSQSLRQSGLAKALAGSTTIEEVLRATGIGA